MAISMGCMSNIIGKTHLARGRVCVSIPVGIGFSLAMWYYLKGGASFKIIFLKNLTVGSEEAGNDKTKETVGCGGGVDHIYTGRDG